MAHGLKGMIGKGLRTPEVKQAMIEHKAVYMAATGGAGALLAQRIVGNETIAYPSWAPRPSRGSRSRTSRPSSSRLLRRRPIRGRPQEVRQGLRLRG